MNSHFICFYLESTHTVNAQPGPIRLHVPVGPMCLETVDGICGVSLIKACQNCLMSENLQRTDVHPSLLFYWQVVSHSHQKQDGGKQKTTVNHVTSLRRSFSQFYRYSDEVWFILILKRSANFQWIIGIVYKLIDWKALNFTVANIKKVILGEKVYEDNSCGWFTTWDPFNVSTVLNLIPNGENTCGL